LILNPYSTSGVDNYSGWWAISCNKLHKLYEPHIFIEMGWKDHKLFNDAVSTAVAIEHLIIKEHVNIQ
jgi:hypothetical protein